MLFKIRALAAGLVITGVLAFSGCATVPKTNPTDTLIYFTINIDELPGSFAKAVFQSADKSWSVGTAYDSEFSKSPHVVICYVTLPNDMPTYLSEIHSDNSGIFTGKRYDMYTMTSQESPLRVTRSSAKANILYGGALKFHLIKNSGLFKQNSFTLRRCTDCPPEKAALQYLSNAGDKGDELLLMNNYLAKIKAKLKGMK